MLKLLENNIIKSSTEKQSSAIVVYKPKRTATSTRTIHTRQSNPYRLGAAPAGVVGALSRCCPAATVPAAVVFACQETCGPHVRAYEFRQDRQPWKKSSTMKARLQEEVRLVEITQGTRVRYTEMDVLSAVAGNQ